MAKSMSEPASAAAEVPNYTVVARRYRPQQFNELIGQEHVAKALVNALQTGRVAHAYLFTGARGVGKTSAARILAKALNCERGTSAVPCDQCQSCLAVMSGDDVDVLEIDGASNNKVEEIRDLRQGVGFRPTRGRFKIYIIDEVHMLSTSAFNALLKTLEEPPPHVKFILATTEVQKIPITILSRCQRFDFAHVGPAKIFDQLKSIVQREGHQADDDALKLVARRAGGSMRDSQSLLDQLLASSPGKLTAEHVAQVLGTAGDDRVISLAAAILAGDPKTALDLISQWVDRGLQTGELVDQLVDYWRALMLVSCGGPDVRELPCTPNQLEAVKKHVQSVSLDAILAGLEVLTATKTRMRGSTHTLVLLEMSVVRLCKLGELLSVPQLVAALGQGGAVQVAAAPVSSNGNGMPARQLPAAQPQPPSVPPTPQGDASKKNSLTAAEPGVNGSSSTDGATVPLTESTLHDVWERFIQYATKTYPLLAKQLSQYSSYAIFGPNALAVYFPAGYDAQRASCASEANTQRLQDALRKVTGQAVAVKFERDPNLTAKPVAAPAAPVVLAAGNSKHRLSTLPLFKKAAEVLGAEIRGIDDDFNPAAAPPAKTLKATDAETDEE
jgi:DNA polymerase-3 subunit gamma/tau